MVLTLTPRPALPPFSFSPPPSSPSNHLDLGPVSTTANATDSASCSTIPENIASGLAAIPPRPPADFLPERDMQMYGAKPLESGSGRGILRCERCARPVLEWAVADHARICSHVLDGTPLTSKKVKVDKSARAKIDESGKKRRASDLVNSPPSPSKKRARLPLSIGSDDEADLRQFKGMKKSEVKKLLKEKERQLKREAKERERLEIAERKRLRASGPIDLDRRCGVINDKGLPCSRSLTCKTHTVGAKRSVEGRSRPYDELHLEWQRIHNPNFKEPVPRRDRDQRTGGGGSGDRSGGHKDKDGKDKDGKSKYKLSHLSSGLDHTDGAFGGDKKIGNKKKRAILDDAGLEDDLDGHREMEELIRATRFAGDRIKNKFDSTAGMFRFGFGPRKNLELQLQQRREQQQQQQKNKQAGKVVQQATVPPPAGTGSKLSKPDSDESKNDNLQAGNSTSNGSALPNDTLATETPPNISSLISNHTGTTTTTSTATLPSTPSSSNASTYLLPLPSSRFAHSIWRAASFEQMSMGDLLTKALASRPVGPFKGGQAGQGDGGGPSSGKGVPAMATGGLNVVGMIQPGMSSITA